jgi:tetratricopeptide (TPR) repeat protein
MSKTRRAVLGVATACVVIAAGCTGQTPMARDRHEANRRWEESRGKMAVRLAQACFERGEFDQAQEHVAQALKSGVRYAPLYVLAARLQAEKGEFSLARDYAQTARAIDPQSPEAAYVLGTIEHALGRTETAIARFHEASQLDPGRAAFVLAEAELLVERGRAEQAADLLAASTNRVPGSAEVYAALGDVQVTLARYTPAAENYRIALRLDPSRKEVKPRLASALFFAGAYDAAEPILAELVASEPEFAGAWALQMWADCLMALGRVEEARQVYERLHRMDPRDVEPVVSLAKCDISAGQLRAARRRLVLALRQSATHPEANALMGYLLVVEGHPRDAVPHLKVALRDPNLEGRGTVEALLERATRASAAR